MRQKFIVLAFATLLPLGTLSAGALSTSAAAEESQTPETMVRDGLEKVMAAISMFVESIPMYEPPEVLPNGDIIIRRVQPEEDSPDQPDDQTVEPKDT